MKLRQYFYVVLLLVACASTQAQDEVETPAETVPAPDVPQEADEDTFEGSGTGVLEEPQTETSTTASAVLEDIEPALTTVSSDGVQCPAVCTCTTEGEDHFDVNCANMSLTELPTDIDARTTHLNLQNNKLTEIPKSISALSKLQVLNANDNLIMELAPGSISELPELKVLKLANNRLLEYPQELKNGFSLQKLEEIALNGNDIRAALVVENFSNFKAIRKLILPANGHDVSELLCDAFHATLELVCIDSCETQSVNCPDTPEPLGNEFLAAKLPGTIALSNAILENSDPGLPKSDSVDTETTAAPEATTVTANSETSTSSTEIASPSTQLPTRSAAKQAPAIENVALSNVVANPPAEPVDTPVETDIKVGATTTETKGGAVDKSIIGIVVAAMIFIVAGIVIKKNWSSIKRRFSSNPRPANGTAANGTTPEEVPLQEKDKSPV